MLECIGAITLATHDMARSVAFYEALGFVLKFGGPESTFASFHAGSGYLNLTKVSAEKRWSWCGRVIFYVADVDAQYAQHVQPDWCQPLHRMMRRGVSVIFTSWTPTGTNSASQPLEP